MHSLCMAHGHGGDVARCDQELEQAETNEGKEIWIWMSIEPTFTVHVLVLVERVRVQEVLGSWVHMSGDSTYRT